MAAKKSARKKAPAKKKAAVRKASPKKKAAAKRPAKAGAKKAAAASKPAQAKQTEKAEQKTEEKIEEKTDGKISSMSVNLGHVFSLRPRVTTSFRQADFLTARRLLQDEAYADIEEAARAVAEKAL